MRGKVAKALRKAAKANFPEDKWKDAYKEFKRGYKRMNKK